MMKRLKGWTSLLLALVLIFGMTSYAMADDTEKNERANKSREVISFEFKDSEEALWAEAYIGKMQAKDIIKGYTDGTFQPNKPVTQIEALVMAVRLMGLEEEAQSKPSDAPLHFKDEKQIPSWARGHVVVALENGLFSAADDKVQPNKPATRVWTVELLVKALGLEEEALEQMTEIPDFRDVSSIPAGAIGYVNVAVDLGITTGYNDHTFGPNKPVTRGEMAAFLYRTNDELLDHEGAVVVQGSITDISFEGSVADDVYESREGEIMIETYTGASQTYTIYSDLLVEYHHRFITADQLLVNDFITLVVQDGIVVDAALLDKQPEQEVSHLVEFEVELEAADDQELKLKYKNRKGQVSAEFEVKADGEKVRLKGEEALASVEAYLAEIELTPEMSEDTIVEKVLEALAFEEQFEELKIEVKFSDGEKIKIKRENEQSDDHNDDDNKDDDKLEDDEGQEDTDEAAVASFKLKAEFVQGDKASLEYEQKRNRAQAQIDMSINGQKQKLKGDEAVKSIESILEDLALSDDMSKEEVVDAVVQALGMDLGDIKELEIEVEFTNDKEIEVELKLEDTKDDKKSNKKSNKKFDEDDDDDDQDDNDEEDDDDDDEEDDD